MTGTEEVPVEIQEAPKTSKESVIQILQTIGLNLVLEYKDGVETDGMDLDETTDLVSLYRLVCMAGIQDKVRGYFEVSDIEQETLDYIERQFDHK